MLENPNPAAAPVVFTDFDGTITQRDVTDEILSQLAHPSWLEVEQEWTRGSIGSRECLERQLALVETTADELNTLIDTIPFDPAFFSFYQFTRQRGIPLYVVSEGFDYVIARILKRAGINGSLRNGEEMFSNALRLEGRRLVPSFPHSAKPCKHGCANCKAELIRRLRKRRHPVIFVGDGLSDRFAVDLADVVFAKRQLLVYCREQQKACQPFDTFAEVQQEVAVLAGRAAGMRCQV